ncbi:integrase [Pandoraea sputorum]|uniref:Integrase n=1 Tax=Pandoraea sputorum TaxID=93222 RepID=A0A5E5BJV0_9BURK|nr:integrase [Pandoraea sputorum]
MRRRGNGYDTAPLESFWGTRKTERVYNGRFATRAQARQALTESIELFYNRQRMRARYDDVSPAATTARYFSDTLAA